MSERLEIHENVLTSDYIELLDNKKWKLVYCTYANEWCDREHIFVGDTLDEVLEHYPKDRLDDMVDDEWTTQDLIDNYEWGL